MVVVGIMGTTGGGDHMTVTGAYLDGETVHIVIEKFRGPSSLAVMLNPFHIIALESIAVVTYEPYFVWQVTS